MPLAVTTSLRLAPHGRSLTAPPRLWHGAAPARAPPSGAVLIARRSGAVPRAQDPSSSSDQPELGRDEVLRRFFLRAAAIQAGSTSNNAGSSGDGDGIAGNDGSSSSMEEPGSAAAGVPVTPSSSSEAEGSESEELASAAEPLAGGKRGKGGRKQKNKDQQQQQGAASAADAAREVLFTSEQLASDVASDAADVAGSVQQAAEAVQQQTAVAVEAAAEAVAETAATAAAAAADASSSAPSSRLDRQLSAPEPPAGVLQAPHEPAGALPAPGATSAGSDDTSSSTASSGSRSKPPSAAQDRADEVAVLKAQLVGLLASLDRGAAATADQAQRVDNLAHRLEKLGGTVVLSWEQPGGVGKPTMALLDGRWRLLYSSGFTSGSLGGRRPGPSFGSLPTALGQVFQDIYTDKNELDNTVELFLRLSLASLPGLNATVPTAVARLRHTFSIIGANTVEIVFEDTEVKLTGGLQNWLDQLPMFSVPKLPDWLQPDKRLRAARFDVVYLDEQMRITRGDRGELRVFLKGAA